MPFASLPAAISVLTWIVIAGTVVILVIAFIVIMRAIRGSGGSGATPPPPGAVTASRKMVDLIQALSNEQRTPSEQECADLRRWHNEAVSGGISTDVTGPALRAINRLCAEE